MNIFDFRSQFPILNRKINNLPLIYLDNAATTQKPKILIDSFAEFYSTYNSNIHRGIYTLAEESTKMYEEVRSKVINFLQIDPKSYDVVFTKNDTEGANIVSNSLVDIIDSDAEVLISELDHHSVLLPFKLQKNFKVNFIPIKELNIDFERLENYLQNHKVGIIAISSTSNVTGITIDLEKLYNLKNKYGFKLYLDAAQTIPHIVSNPNLLSTNNNHFDFLSFSAHKVFGPTGVGVLTIRKNLADQMRPFVYGGSMITSVTSTGIGFQSSPYKFEGGTPNIADVIVFGKILNWIETLDKDFLDAHIEILSKYAFEKLSEIPGLIWLDPDLNFANRIPIFTFNLKNIHPHDVAGFLSEYNICIRAGQHCAGLLHEKLCLVASCRVSLYYYNTIQEIDILAEKIKLLIDKFS